MKNVVFWDIRKTALTTGHIVSLKLTLTSPTGGGRSVGMGRVRTKSRGVSFLQDNELEMGNTKE
jgi:hypothetical protein